jgi:hypothetical protein
MIDIFTPGNLAVGDQVASPWRPPEARRVAAGRGGSRRVAAGLAESRAGLAESRAGPAEFALRRRASDRYNGAAQFGWPRPSGNAVPGQRLEMETS